MRENLDKLEILICLGSSCFSRGNKKAVHLINAFLDEHMIRDKVNFHGAHCCDNCAQGAILKIGDRVFEEVDLENLNDLLLEAMDKFISRSNPVVNEDNNSLPQNR